MLPRDLTQNIKSRLSTIKGQLDGMLEMLDHEEDPNRIVNLMKTIKGGVDTSYEILSDEVIRKSLARKIVEVEEACPGNCGKEDKIQEIRTQFPNFNSEQVVDNLKAITKIESHIKEYNSHQ